MSFVSIVATESFVSIMSDGRVVGATDGLPIQEDYQKFVVYDKSSFIAYAGTKEVCEMIVRDCEGFFRANIYDFSVWTKVIQELFRALDIESKGFKVQFGFGGVNQDEEIEFHTISSADMKLQSFKPKDDQICYGLLNNTSYGDEFFTEKIVQLLRETGFKSPTDVIQAQKLLNSFVAQNDKSVNNKTFRQVIRIDY